MSRVLDKKLKKVLEMRTDTPAMLESLQAISEFYDEGNTFDARKSLRQDLEKQNYTLAVKFLDQFERLKVKLEAVEKNVSNLENGCEAISQRLAAADDHMHLYMKEAKELEDKRGALGRRRERVAGFLARFQLGGADARALALPPDGSPPPRAFFAALARLGEVRAEAQALVGGGGGGGGAAAAAAVGGGGGGGAGFELLELLARHQERAYEQLYGWVQDQCNQFAEQETPEADATLQVAMRALRARPAYYRHCQESVAALRRRLLRRWFESALGGGGGGGRAAAAAAGLDPDRHAGAALAWTHQASAVEKELVTALFPPAADVAAAVADAPAAAAAALPADVVLGTILSGVAELLKAKLDEAVLVVETPAACLRLEQITRFYAKVLPGAPTDAVGGSGAPPPPPPPLALDGDPAAGWADGAAGPLAGEGADGGEGGGGGGWPAEAAREGAAAARARLLEMLNRAGDRLISSPPSYPMDLSTLKETAETLKMLEELLKIHELSLEGPGKGSVEGNKHQGADSQMEEDQSLMNQMCSALIEPLLRMCRLSAEGLAPSDMAAFMLNNAAAAAAALGSFQGTTLWKEKISSEIDVWLDCLVENEYESMLDSCGLKNVVNLMEVCRNRPDPLSAQPGLDVDNLTTAMTRFYSSIFTLVMPDFDKVQQSSIKIQARQRTALALANAHEAIYEMVTDDKNHYSTRSFLQHTPQQVRVLLDCD